MTLRVSSLLLASPVDGRQVAAENIERVQPVPRGQRRAARAEPGHSRSDDDVVLPARTLLFDPSVCGKAAQPRSSSFTIAVGGAARLRSNRDAACVKVGPWVAGSGSSENGDGWLDEIKLGSSTGHDEPPAFWMASQLGEADIGVDGCVV
jgi:hypothetical protein